MIASYQILQDLVLSHLANATIWNVAGFSGLLKRWFSSFGFHKILVSSLFLPSLHSVSQPPHPLFFPQFEMPLQTDGLCGVLCQ